MSDSQVYPKNLYRSTNEDEEDIGLFLNMKIKKNNTG